MSYEPTITGKDLRAVSGINLILNILEELRKLQVSLGNVVFTSAIKSKLIDHTGQIKGIIGTAGSIPENRLLIAKLGKLNHEITKEFPYVPLIKKSIREVEMAFQMAIGAAFQNWEKIKQQAVVKALGNEPVLNEPTALHRKLLNLKDLQHEQVVD